MTEYISEDLLNRAKAGEKEAAESLMQINSGLIWSVARRFFGRGVDPDDLYQLGCMGMLKAIQGFDTQYGTQFSTYAVPKIAGEIRRFLRDDGSVKVSRTLKERAATVKMTRTSLEQRLGREPNLSELSQELGLTPEEIAECELATSAADSLQRETGSDGFTLEAMLGDGGQEEKLLERVSLREAVEKLPEREKMVIVLRFYRDMTQQSAAKVLRISQVQVSRTEKRAVERLRAMLA